VNIKDIKQRLVRDILDAWDSADLQLKEGGRQDKLRPEIISRLLTNVMTDDERAEFYGLPNGCRMREGAKIISKENLKCGEFVWIGENAVLDASGGLEIGSHTSVGLSVYLWSHTSQMTNLTMENFSGSPLIERKPTKIGSGVFIAGPSVILSGVTIGNKVIVAPLSVVNKDIPDYSVVAGNPAKVIKTISEEYINEERNRILGVCKEKDDTCG
jgi:acetyltransferase-like isoleucine patch superfamily enzyme